MWQKEILTTRPWRYLIRFSPTGFRNINWRNCKGKKSRPFDALGSVELFNKHYQISASLWEEQVISGSWHWCSNQVAATLNLQDRTPAFEMWEPTSFPNCYLHHTYIYPGNLPDKHCHFGESSTCNWIRDFMPYATTCISRFTFNHFGIMTLWISKHSSERQEKPIVTNCSGFLESKDQGERRGMQDHCVRPGRPSLITSIHPGTTSNIRSHVHSFRPKTTPISSILCSYGWRKRGVQESTHLGRDVVRQLGEAVEVELGPLLQSHRASRKTM